MNRPPTMATLRQTRDLDWNDVALLLAICRAGNLAGAARALGSTHSTVFRRLNGIEDKTGVRFFERLPHGYVMTEAGEAAKRCGERMEAEMFALGREVLGRDMELRGKIRMTAPEGIAMTFLPTILGDFHRQHPNVSVDLIVTPSSLDLGQREADLALRVTIKPPDTLLGRRICGFGNNVYAAPAYLERHGEIALSEQTWIMSAGSAPLIIPKIWKNSAEAEPHIIMTSDSLSTVIGAARNGLGLVTLPSFLGDPDPGLVAVPHHLGGMKLELWLLTHTDLRHTARVKALMAHVHAALAQHAALFEGQGGNSK